MIIFNSVSAVPIIAVNVDDNEEFIVIDHESEMSKKSETPLPQSMDTEHGSLVTKMMNAKKTFEGKSDEKMQENPIPREKAVVKKEVTLTFCLQI
jgi:hypothetical protein